MYNMENGRKNKFFFKGHERKLFYSDGGDFMTESLFFFITTFDKKCLKKMLSVMNINIKILARIDTLKFFVMLISISG